MLKRQRGGLARRPRRRGVAAEFFVDTSAWYPLLVKGHPAVMAERGIGEAMTLDHHFGVAGFRMVGGKG